jgi:hypothetical protein
MVKFAGYSTRNQFSICGENSSIDNTSHLFGDYLFCLDLIDIPDLMSAGDRRASAVVVAAAGSTSYPWSTPASSNVSASATVLAAPDCEADIIRENNRRKNKALRFDVEHCSPYILDQSLLLFAGAKTN